MHLVREPPRRDLLTLEKVLRHARKLGRLPFELIECASGDGDRHGGRGDGRNEAQPQNGFEVVQQCL